MYLNTLHNDVEMQNLKLTIEDIDSQDCFKNLSPEKKEKLISFIFAISSILYNSNRKGDE
jgi:hypothetical protein